MRLLIYKVYHTGIEVPELTLRGSTVNGKNILSLTVATKMNNINKVNYNYGIDCKNDVFITVTVTLCHNPAVLAATWIINSALKQN